MIFAKPIRKNVVLLGLVMVPGAITLICAAAACVDAPAVAQKDDSPFAKQRPLEVAAKVSDLVVHEWGTFLGMSSSDGTSLDGMYHEEHALPSFVHGRGKDQLKLPIMLLKGETPVIYFYTKERQKVRVGVGFPRGIWTQWYPQAAAVLPYLATQAEQSGELKNGRICWYAEVIPRWAMPHVKSNHAGTPAELVNMLPQTSSDALWNHARLVDAAFVKVGNGSPTQQSDEYERFLFYRGLGEASLPLHIQEKGQGTLTLDAELNLGAGVRDVFVLRVEKGRGAYRYCATVRPGESISGVIPSMNEAKPLAEFAAAIGDELAARLSESGLFAKEARAMVNTWSTSYFQTEGIRVLFVLPQSWTDAFIPMTLDPEPRKLVRVMVGRLEMLSANREARARAAIADLASPDSSARAQAFEFLRQQGRYVEPIVRHVAKTTTDAQLKSLCRRLLITDFVTDLRAALNNASDGKPINCDPVLLRAHLARTLRQAGQDAAAAVEAKTALDGLARLPVPAGQKLEDSSLAAEIKATSLEAQGDDTHAAGAYAHRVALLSRGMPLVDETQIPGLREWWVGHAYAQCVIRSGQSLGRPDLPSGESTGLAARLRHRRPTLDPNAAGIPA